MFANVCLNFKDFKADLKSVKDSKLTLDNRFIVFRNDALKEVHQKGLAPLVDFFTELGDSYIICCNKLNGDLSKLYRRPTELNEMQNTVMLKFPNINVLMSDLEKNLKNLISSNKMEYFTKIIKHLKPKKSLYERNRSC